ncbi:MAG: FHA domain-containing protein [Enhygromyxa sp.]
MIVELKFGATSRQLNHFKTRVMVGRDEQECELWVNDSSVSRRHAELWLEGDTVYIRDLGSANGTWLDGQPLGAQAAALAPGQTVHVGHAPLGVIWPSRGGASTSMAPPSAELLAAMAYRAQQQAMPAQPQYAYAPGHAPAPGPGYAPGYAPAPAPAPAPPPGFAPPPAQPAPAHQHHAPPAQSSPAAFQAQQAAAQAGTGVAAAVGVGGTAAPQPGELTYRRQGGNDNGTLLIALPGDTFANDSTLDGFLEFTATDNETVASIVIELIEFHKRGPKKGHVWDRCLVRQGPWKTKKGDVLPMQFRLRVPSGTSASSPVCHWSLRAYVDIKWAIDIEATAPINMRNTDIEKIRDALGSLDYRIARLEAEPLGQKYRGKFNPPMHMVKQLNITDVNLDIEYVGANVKIMMEVEKNRLFHFDKKQEFVFDLARLRAASVQDLATHWQTEINKLMS